MHDYSTLTAQAMRGETPFARTFSALLRPEHLWGPSAFDRPSSVPRFGGIYAWYFADLPGVPSDGCHRALNHTLLYIGTAPRERTQQAVKAAETLRCLLAGHFRGNAEKSPLRLTLGCLLSDALGIELRRVGGDRRFTFTKAGERALDAWMAQNARVVWSVVDRPWEIKKALLASLSLPLNIADNSHPFVATLQQARRQAKARARSLPIVCGE